MEMDALLHVLLKPDGYVMTKNQATVINVLLMEVVILKEGKVVYVQIVKAKKDLVMKVLLVMKMEIVLKQTILIPVKAFVIIGDSTL